jgi:hypothetical protein
MLTLAAVAGLLAQAAPPPLPPPASPPGASPATTSTAAPAPAAAAETGAGEPFARSYRSARARLATGDFAEAAADFAEAARLATNPCDRSLAEEQRQLAADWAARNLAFVQRAALGEGGLSAKAVDVRTSDEIVSLYTSAIFYGLGTGAWIDVLTQGSSAASLILPSLIAGGAAAGGVALMDSGRGLRYGVPQSIVSGMYLGLEEGVLWALWSSTSSNEWSGPAMASVIWGATTVGAMAGGLVAQLGSTTPGRAAYVGSTGLWTGTVAGLLAEAVTPSTASSSALSAPLAVGAVGVAAGAIAGIVTATGVSPSIAHVRFIDLGGLVGFIAAGGLYFAAANQNANAQAFSAIAAAGTIAGLGTAWYATRSMPRDDGPTDDAPRAASIDWTPSVSPVPGGGTIGIAGSM